MFQLSHNTVGTVLKLYKSHCGLQVRLFMKGVQYVGQTGFILVLDFLENSWNYEIVVLIGILSTHVRSQHLMCHHVIGFLKMCYPLGGKNEILG